MIRQIPVEEKATILASLAYIIALAFYKHWLRSQYDVMNGSLIERAFATAGKPWYWFFLLTGFAFIILLVCMGVHLFRKDMDKPGNLVGVFCLGLVPVAMGLFAAWRKRYWNRLRNCQRILMEETKPAEDADKTAQATPSHAIQ